MKKLLSIVVVVLLFLVSVYFIAAYVNTCQIDAACVAAAEAAQLYLAETYEEHMIVSHVSYFFVEELFTAYYYPASNPSETYRLDLADRNRWKGPFAFDVWGDSRT
ncbi:MAG: hypothetical protein GXY32_10415 [Ruminococcaceae bacterium]|nr:hypothetical protein [Oscillospiraceae bacterium]